MLNEFFDKESIPEILSIRKGQTIEFMNGSTAEAGPYFNQARDFIRLVDLPGLAKMARDEGTTYLRLVARDIEDGDDDAAAEIEKIISKIEAGMLLSRRATVSEGVTGAFPHVPNFIQGNPYNMRTKRNEKSGRGPLSFYIETTVQSGFTGEGSIIRMASMIALAKNLAQVRPLDFWITATYGGVRQLCQLAVRLDTTPIDYARVAALCTHVEKFNNLQLQMASRDIGKRREKADHREDFRSFGSWAYGVPQLERKYAGEILGRVVSPGSQVCYLGAALWAEFDDDAPEKWIKKMLAQYGRHLIEGEDFEDVNEGEAA